MFGFPNSGMYDWWWINNLIMVALSHIVVRGWPGFARSSTPASGCHTITCIGDIYTTGGCHKASDVDATALLSQSRLSCSAIGIACL